MRKFALICGLALGCSLLLTGKGYADNAPPVRASQDAAQIHMDNGALALTINRAKSEIVSILYQHDGQTTEMCKSLYYSASAGPLDKNAPRPPAGSISIRAIQPARLALSTPDVAEAVMENGPTPTYPFHTETHYLLNRGVSGLYAYQIYSHPKDQPAATIGEARFVLKGPPGPGLYTNHVVDAQRFGPYDPSPVVKEVSNATYLLKDGTIYTKYDNSAFMADHYTHGMTGHGVGAWMINASNEYINGGPLKQELTVHSDNTLLNMLQGAHYGSGVLNFQAGEEWNKLYGPFLVYFNTGASAQSMYKDALARVDVERAQWPYRWLQSPDYSTDRGTVRGQITLTGDAQGKTNSTGNVGTGGKTNAANSTDSTDSASNVVVGKPLVAANAWVVLAAPGGDWPLQGKGYEFWMRTDAQGRFTIPKVRPGQYTLYAVGANQFEQFAQNDVLVQPGQTTNLGALKWQTITHGKTLWQIGTPDRSTQEFRDGSNTRHFANYLRYAANFPDDVTFTVGKSHEATDWNYAQWTWYAKRPYWTIRFDLAAPRAGKATLTLGIAASNPLKGGSSNLRIRVNGQEVSVLRLTKSGPAAYRSGGQDSLYRVEYVTFDAALLKAGTNEITLGHTDAQPLPSPEEQQAGRVGAILYDALRLEVEPLKADKIVDQKADQKAAATEAVPAIQPGLPTLFIIGDSTVKNHTKGLEGWGDPIASRFDKTKINVVNNALGGRSSRTFLTEGLWDKTLGQLKAGDFVLMQFGHNDGGSVTTSYRASLKGGGDETRDVTDAKTGKSETVHTYGWYIRRYIADAKAKHATPIVLSPVPRDIWTDAHTVARAASDYGKWAQDAAQSENVAFIDLNDIVAKHYETLGPDKVKAAYFPGDHTHTSPEGAELNAACVVEGLRALKDCPLILFLL